MQLASIASILSAAFCSYHDKEGWGWFLLSALLLSSSITFKDKNNVED